jgi:apolipoprotein N-acyltransferase
LSARALGAVSRVPHLCAFAAGAVAVAGFGDRPLFLLPLAATAVLFWLWTKAPAPRTAAWIGFAFGAGLFLVGVSWVYVSLHDFGGMPLVLAGFATLLFCLYLALFPAAVGYLQAKLAVPRPVQLMLVLPALWTLAEWIRGWLFTGFPWLTLGYSQLDGPLAGYAPIVGVFGVSLAACIAAGSVAAIVVCRGRARFAGIATLVVIGTAGVTWQAVDWVAPHGGPVTVSLLQGNISQDQKFIAARYASTLATYARLVEASQARLVVLPEVAIPRFLDQVDPAYIERLAKHAAARGADVLVGVPVLDRDRRYYNEVVSFGASPTQHYKKSHLVPFGEFVPTGFRWVLAFVTIPLGDFTRGEDTQRPLAVAGQQVAMNICYEDAFGEEIIRPLPDATLLANVSNVAWFGDSLAPEQHLRISRMRALETGRYMLRATNTGVTAIVDTQGEVTGRLKSFTEGALEGTVQGYVGATPYVIVGNWPAVLICCVIVAGTALLVWRRGGRRSLGPRSRASA